MKPGPVRFPEVLRYELEQLRPDIVLPAAQPDATADLQALNGEIAQARPVLSALCFSGGGIRSATFNLGVLQGLARLGLLEKFDYLSSVSGGGYIAAWLRTWMARKGSAAVIQALKPHPVADPLCPEPEEIAFLRDYSNYLSPRLGLLSADTWTLGAIVTRNLILNWLVILPLLAALVAFPQLCYLLVRNAMQSSHLWLSGGLLGLAVLLALFAAYKVHDLRRHSEPRGTGQLYYLGWGMLPVYLAATLLALAGAFLPATLSWAQIWGFCFLWCVAVPVAGWLPSVWEADRPLHPTRKAELAVLIASGLTATALLAVLIHEWRPGLLARPALYTTLAGPILLGVYLLSRVLYVGLISRSGGGQREDADQEWWARLSGWMLIAIIGWLVFSIIVLWGGHYAELLRVNQSGPSWLDKALASVGGISGLLVALFGNSGDTKASAQGSSASRKKEWMLSLAAPIFCLCLFVVLAQGTAWLGWRLSPEGLALDVIPERSPFDASGRDGSPVYYSHIFAFLALILALLALSRGMGRFVNVNRFSLHGLYRNRLVRAYLGASHADRVPDPFTGFDALDNYQLHQVWTPDATRPLPVINCAWNLVGGSSEKLAWQQRKAKSFAMTPFYCGNYTQGYRSAKEYGGPEGISIGTAVAISGAAANPNMGYHSSPLLSFLMTLFNARLGAWLGNPGTEGEATYSWPGPRQAVEPLLAELFGMTDSKSRYVNLSDGGHFENLGVYEMVLRRCRFILVSDAGNDESCAFEDLGNAIRKIRIDFGIPIEFKKKVQIFPRKEPGTTAFCAVARIRYDLVDGTAEEDNGVLIYFKPTLASGDEPDPQDVYSYAKASDPFPHETTADQFFSEAQFESYRALGSHLVDLLGARATLASFADFKQTVDRYLASREHRKVG